MCSYAKYIYMHIFLPSMSRHSAVLMRQTDAKQERTPYRGQQTDGIKEVKSYQSDPWISGAHSVGGCVDSKNGGLIACEFLFVKCSVYRPALMFSSWAIDSFTRMWPIRS